MMVNINEYIDWNSIWIEKVLHDNPADVHSNNKELVSKWKSFLKENPPIDVCNCQVNDESITFSFGESFGHTEGNPEGDYYNYDIEVDEDFTIISIEYEQG